MDAVALTIGISWVVTGLLTIAMSVPLARGTVDRNAAYGMRFPQAMTSDEAWVAINRFGGKWMIIWSVPLVAVGVACLFLPLAERPAAATVVGLAPLVFLLIPVLQTWRFARRLGARR